jgi:hypothetical protein
MATRTAYVRHRVFVDVLGDDPWIAEDREGELYFPVRPSCMVLGIDSTTALETVKADSRRNVGLAPLRLPTEGGGDQGQQCLRRLEYAWWLGGWRSSTRAASPRRSAGRSKNDSAR